MRRRVTFVLPSLYGGGDGRVAVTLLDGLADSPYELTLYLFAREGAYLDRVGPHVRLIEGQSGRAARLIGLRRFLAQEPQDIVVSFLSHFTAYAATRSARTGARFMICQGTPLTAFLDDPDYEWRRPLRRRIFAAAARRIYPRADLVAATSRGVADDLVANYGVPADRIAVVHNPVDVAEVERLGAAAIDGAEAEGDMPTIVVAGRLAHAKNLPLLVASLEILARRMPFRVWILGEGELEPELRQLLAQASLTDRVHLLGFQANPWRYMARADVFLLTSRYEGFGNVLIEAMACGVPVVATGSYGTREIVQHERTGLLVDAHEPVAVAAALERVLTDTILRARLAASARATAREFSLPAVSAQFAGAIDRALATSSDRWTTRHGPLSA